MKDEKYPHIVYVDRGNTQIIEKEPSPDARIQTDHLEGRSVHSLIIKFCVFTTWKNVVPSFLFCSNERCCHCINNRRDD